MLWILLGTVIGAGLGRIAENIPCDKGISSVAGGVVGVFVAGILTLPISLGIWESTDRVWTQVESTHLVAVRSADALRGHFFLGTGSVEGHTVYRYFSQQSDKGMVQEEVSAGEATIYEQPREDGVVEVWRQKVVQEPSLWIAYPVGPKVRGRWLKFYVPEGTVRRGFEL